jgi:hypothetical protein
VELEVLVYIYCFNWSFVLELTCSIVLSPTQHSVNHHQRQSAVRIEMNRSSSLFKYCFLYDSHIIGSDHLSTQHMYRDALKVCIICQKARKINIFLYITQLHHYTIHTTYQYGNFTRINNHPMATLPLKNIDEVTVTMYLDHTRDFCEKLLDLQLADARYGPSLLREDDIEDSEIKLDLHVVEVCGIRKKEGPLNLSY